MQKKLPSSKFRPFCSKVDMLTPDSWWCFCTFPLCHLFLKKMTVISQTTFSNVFSWIKKVLYIESNFTEVLPRGPIDHKLSLVQVMTWRRTGDKPLPEPMLIQFADAYLYAALSLWVNYVPRKMPDVRSRYARFTIAPIDVRMLRYMDERYGLFTTKINHIDLERQELRKLAMKRVVLSTLLFVIIFHHFLEYMSKFFWFSDA